MHPNLIKFSFFSILCLQAQLPPSAAAAPSWSVCDLRPRGERTGELLRKLNFEASNEYIHVASFHGLRELNTTLSDGGVGGEHLVSSLLYLMQFHLFKATRFMDPNHFAIGHGSSPYVKYVQFKLKLKAVDKGELSSVFSLASSDAVEDLVSYMRNPDGDVGQMIRTSAKHFSEKISFVFPGQEERIPQLDSQQVRKIWQKLITHFASEESLKKFLNKAIGTGVATTDIDAKLVARMQVMYHQKFANEFFFNYEMLGFAITQISRAMRSVSWFFIGRSPEQLQSDFIEIRRNIFKSTTWSEAYRRILQRGVMQAEITAEQLLLVESMRDQQLKNYVDTLGLLDYLPEDRLVLDPQARRNFDNLKSPTHIGLLDIRGLGGMNFNRFHESVGKLRTKLATLIIRLRRLNELESANAPVALIDEEQLQVTANFNDILAIRTQILAESDRFVREVRESLSNRLRSLNIGENNFAIWASGDDAFFSIRGPGIDATKIAHTLKSDPLIYQWARIVVFDVAGERRTVPLSEARLSLGAAADVLKFFEAMTPNFEIALTGTTANIQDLQLHTLDSTLQTEFSPAPQILLDIANPYFAGFNLRVR